jgi:hypothetical protein
MAADRWTWSHAALACLLAAGAGNAHAQSWFTVLGDIGDTSVDTVQVAPDTVAAFADLRAMTIRTSRGRLRTGFDGASYRSYVAQVHVDCDSRIARFKQLDLFAAPMWTGARREFRYADAEMPRMVFKDMQPNPVERIVQAACTVQNVQTR